MRTLERECGRPNEVCIGFDFYAEYCIEGLGMGRWIDRREALAILEKADAAGLVQKGDEQTQNPAAAGQSHLHAVIPRF